MGDAPPRAKPGACLHYKAVFGPHAARSCAAGVIYSDLVGNEPGWAGRLPCARDVMPRLPKASCDKYQEPTAEQIAAWRAHVDGSFAKLTEALRRIAHLHKASGAWEGTVECPACAGRLHWTKARVNGHVHGRCETKGCLTWMQ